MTKSSENQKLLDEADASGKLVREHVSGDVYWLLKASQIGQELSTEGTSYWYLGNKALVADEHAVELAGCVSRCLGNHREEFKILALRHLLKDRKKALAVMSIEILKGASGVAEYFAFAKHTWENWRGEG